MRRKGNVSFAAQGSTVGGVGGNSTAQRRDLRHLSVFSRKHRRGFLSSIADAFKGALDSIKRGFLRILASSPVLLPRHNKT